MCYIYNMMVYGIPLTDYGIPGFSLSVSKMNYTQCWSKNITETRNSVICRLEAIVQKLNSFVSIQFLYFSQSIVIFMRSTSYQPHLMNEQEFTRIQVTIGHLIPYYKNKFNKFIKTKKITQNNRRISFHNLHPM